MIKKNPHNVYNKVYNELLHDLNELFIDEIYKSRVYYDNKSIRIDLLKHNYITNYEVDYKLSVFKYINNVKVVLKFDSKNVTLPEVDKYFNQIQEVFNKIEKDKN